MAGLQDGFFDPRWVPQLPMLDAAHAPLGVPVRTHGKGSVQSIPQEPLGQANALSRLAGSFGQPSLDMVRDIREHGERTGQLPEWGFSDAVGMMGTMPMGPFGSVRPPRIPNPIRAYHGSPYRFDEFDLGRFGTGEGRIQDVPFGVNIASEDLARFYRDSISRQRNMSPGHMYEVDAHVDPSHLINLRAPISQQSEPVRQALGQLGYDLTDTLGAAQRRADQAYAAWRASPSPETDAAYRAAQQALNSERIVGIERQVPMRTRQDVAPLIEAGIPGATVAPGQHVIFDDQLIEILRRYGIAGPAAGAGLAAGLSNGQPQQ